MKKLIFFLLFLSLSYSCYGLRISGITFKYEYDFYPGLNRTHDFIVTNEEGYTADYTLFAKRISGADLREYFRVEPVEMKDVLDSESRPFRVFMNLPQTLETPGESETWIKVDVNPKLSEKGIMALPSLGIRYIIFVPYPYPYLQWKFNMPNLNINETAQITNYVKNYGSGPISPIFANMTIINMLDGSTVQRLTSEQVNNLNVREENAFYTSFSGKGLSAGNYKIFATLNWGGNISSTEQDFKIGSKFVRLVDFTKEFKKDSINRMLITVESGWNSKIDVTYADIIVYAKDKSSKLKEFKSLTQELYPFQQRQIEAYFDANGIEPGEYPMVVILRYDGDANTREEIIKIGEFDAETVTEMPNQFMITPISLMIIAIIIFIILNIFLFVKYARPKKKEIPQDIIENIKQLREKYSDPYIKEMMVKKGWDPEKVEELIREAKKPNKVYK